VSFALVYAGKYKTEDELKMQIDMIQKQNKTQPRKSKQRKK